MIPIISLKNYLANPEAGLEKVASEIDKAFKECGTFFLKDHGMDWSIAENCLRDLTTFFEMPVEKKRIYQCHNLHNGRGFIPFEAQNVNAFMGRLGYPNDALERFSFGRIRPPIGGFVQDDDDFTETWSPNIYSSEPKTFRESVEKFYEAADQLSLHLMQIFSFLLGQELGFFEKNCSNASHMLKGTYYQVVENPPPGQDRIACHTDIIPFTVLLPDQSKEGLWIQTVGGKWIPANAPPGCFIVSPGDCMERLTNKIYAALPHKVPFPEDPSKMTPRTSVGFFPQMNGDCMVQTVPKFLDKNQNSSYEPILYGKIFALKFENLHKKDKTFDNFKTE